MADDEEHGGTFRLAGASAIRVKLNSEGALAILQGTDVMDDLVARAQRIAAAASAGGSGGTFLVEQEVTTERARVVVVTADADAMVAEARDRSLTRAVDAGR